MIRIFKYTDQTPKLGILPRVRHTATASLDRLYHVLVSNLNRLQSNVFINLGAITFHISRPTQKILSIFRIKVV